MLTLYSLYVYMYIQIFVWIRLTVTTYMLQIAIIYLESSERIVNCESWSPWTWTINVANYCSGK